MFQKNAITVYSEYSYSGIVPKERAHSFADAIQRAHIQGLQEQTCRQ